MIPKQFRLSNRLWRVKIVAPATIAKEAGTKPSKAPRGVCLPEVATIYLNNDYPADDIEHTFFHEMYHAMLIADGVMPPHDEEAVDRMGAYLHSYHLSKKGEHSV